MAHQLLDQGLTGFAAAATEDTSTTSEIPKKSKRKSIDTPHYHFIHSMLLPSTKKLQKELRGRRFRKIRQKLGAGITWMEEFQYLMWPEDLNQHHNNDELMPIVRTSLDVLEDHAFFDQSSSSFDPLDSNSVDGDFSANADYDYLMDFGDEPLSNNNNTNNENNNNTNNSPDDDGDDIDVDYADFPAYEDDPETRLNLHESVTYAMEAYIMIFNHPSKTVKACNMALECISQLVFREYFSGRAGGQDDYSGSGASYRSLPVEERPVESLLHRLLIAIEKCGASQNLQRHVIECFKAILNSPKCSVHGASMLVAIRSIFQIHLTSKHPDCKEIAKTTLMELISQCIQRMEEYPLEDTNSLYHADSYLLIKRLVHLSSKKLPESSDSNATNTISFPGRQLFNTVTIDTKTVKNKILSLELILLIMECAGDQIKRGPKFVTLVQSRLCVALLQNCISNHTRVAATSQKIFLVLVYKYKNQLKSEVEVFMKNIFLRVLDSEYSSFHQKAIVLESLRSLCEDDVLLTQIFLNYDCDLDSMNLYKDMVMSLAELAQKSIKETAIISKKEEQFELGLASIEILVTILHTFLKTMGNGFENYKQVIDTAGSRMRKDLELDDSVQTFVKKRLNEQGAVEEQRKDDTIKSVEPFEDPDVEESESNLSSDTLGAMIDIFDRKQHAEKKFGTGGVKFAFSVNKGLAFFVDHGFVSIDARRVAEFLLENKEKLEKTQIGEVLGKQPELSFPFEDLTFPIEPSSDPTKGASGFFGCILQNYVDLFDFSGIEFDEAIRSFLSGFRLPGEAQKIDRIMEKFAAKYTQQNTDVFANADTAFILAFSIIMLNTDLHNPSIKSHRRMTLDAFINNNRGIGENGADLPEEFLAEIFKRIKERPFSLKEDEDARKKAATDEILKDGGGLFFGRRVESHKQEQFKKEQQEMMTTTEQAILRRKEQAQELGGNLADSVSPVAVAKPMFDAAKDIIIETLSKVMEVMDDDRNIAVCLSGFQYAFRIGCAFNLPEARNACVKELAKLTTFDTLMEIKYKTTEAILLLMDIAVTDGDWLGESWDLVLACLSHLLYMMRAAPDLLENEEIKKVSSNPAFRQTRKNFKKRFFRKNQDQSDLQLSKEAEIVMKMGIIEDISDQVFENVFDSTTQLSPSAVQSFTEQLLNVSVAQMEEEGIKKESNVIFDMSNLKVDNQSLDDTGDIPGLGSSDSSLEDLKNIETMQAVVNEFLENSRTTRLASKEKRIESERLPFDSESSASTTSLSKEG